MSLPRANGQLILLLLLLMVHSANSQHVHMQNHQSSFEKNIFLVMMDSMMIKMDKVSEYGPAETYFISKMIPHHEGAIEMAEYEIKYGKDFAMIQLAKSILAEQTNEIVQMRLWLTQHSTGGAIPPDFPEALNETMTLMMQSMPVSTTLTDTDRAFASVMIPHHQAAIDMAKVVLRFSINQQTISFAMHIISIQEVEIEQMSFFVHRLKHYRLLRI